MEEFRRFQGSIEAKLDYLKEGMLELKADVREVKAACEARRTVCKGMQDDVDALKGAKTKNWDVYKGVLVTLLTGAIILIASIIINHI